MTTFHGQEIKGTQEQEEEKDDTTTPAEAPGHRADGSRRGCDATSGGCRGKAAPARTAHSQVNFAEEYAYVYTDLKRVAIIAAAMLVILIVLSFVIT